MNEIQQVVLRSFVKWENAPYDYRTFEDIFFFCHKMGIIENTHDDRINLAILSLLDSGFILYQLDETSIHPHQFIITEDGKNAIT